MKSFLFVNGPFVRKLRSESFIIHYRYNSTLVDLLSNLTGCTKNDAKRCLNIGKRIHILGENGVKKNHEVLQEYRIPKSNINEYLSLLQMHPFTLKNRCMALEECGFVLNKIDLKLLTLKRFVSIMNTSVEALILQGYAKESYNLFLHLSKFLGLSSEYSLTKEKCLSLTEIRKLLLQEYFKLKFGDLWKDGKIDSRIQYRSLRLISECFEMLSKDFRVPLFKIKNCMVLLSAQPDNLKAILRDVPALLDGDIRNIIVLHPKVCLNSIENISAIIRYLKEFNITSESLCRCPAILTLHRDSVVSRMEQLKDHPQLSHWIDNSTILYMIVYSKKCTDRLNKYEQANVKCISFHAITSSNDLFQKRMEAVDKSHQYETVKLLSRVLAMKKEDVRKKLQIHSYWLFVPYFDIEESLRFLQEQGFSNEHIISSIWLLLYPRKIIQEELVKLNDREGIECCRNPEDGNLRKETILPLILYMIEQPYHFKNESIWGYR